MIGDEEKNDITIPNKIGIYTVRINPYNQATGAKESVFSILELFR